MIPFAVVSVGVLLAALAWWCVVHQASGKGRPLLEDLRDWIEDLAKDIDEHEMELTGWTPPNVPVPAVYNEMKTKYETASDIYTPHFSVAAKLVHNIPVESTPLLPFDNVYYHYWPTDVPPAAPTKLEPVIE